jgi:predicted small integral membrane protein
MDLSWMAWTTPTAIFFVTIFLLLCGMTVWEVVQPTVPRKGLLPLVTTRGDRFFISLLSGAWLHLAWMYFTDITLWVPLAIMAVGMAVILRWG